MRPLPRTALLFCAGAILGCSHVPTASAQAVADGKQDVWIALLPKSPIRSIKEYHQTCRTYPPPSPPLYTPVPLPACDLEIRRAKDQTRVARIPYAGYFREVRTLSETDRRRISPLPDGEYRLALCRAEKRCSNVAVLVVDRDYDASQARTIRLVPLEPAPGQALPYLGIRGTGPSPVDPDFTSMSVQCPALIVDGVRRSLTMINGHFHPIGVGKQSNSIIDLSRYVPKIAPGADHTMRAVTGRYESRAALVSLKAPLGEVWDKATPGLPPWREREPVLRGTVVGPDGKPGSGYEVVLQQGALRHREKCTIAGTFMFLNIPPGAYRLHANPPGKGQPTVTEKAVRILADRTLVRNLSLELLFSFSGRVTGLDGKPVPGRMVSATWRSPDGTREFGDSSITDVDGRYTLSSPFPKASYVGLSGTGRQPRPRRKVAAGRKDVDFSIER